MATAEAERVTTAYRRQQTALRAIVVRDLVRLWPTLDWRRLDATYPAWAVAVGRSVQVHRQTASALAASYLRAFRTASGVPGAAEVVLRTEIDAPQLAIALRTTSVAALKTAAANGTPPKMAMDNAFVMSSGAASRLVLDAGRDTVLASLRTDGRAEGWQRITSGRACQFCSMLAGRGAVYSADTADFQSHDHCGCTAQPVYR